MKTTRTLLLACIVSTILLQSCSNTAGLSITKRHYRNGYHIEYVSGRHAEKNTLAVQPLPAIAADEIHAPEKTAQVIAPAPGNSAEQRTVSTSSYASQMREKLGAVHSDSKQVKAQRHFAAPIIAFEKKQIAHSKVLRKLVPSASRHDDGDALSLFWILILVLIILWAFGYAGGGWGLGWAIHVLLVIALILLILWLLHLI